jgi:hypothetical protein
MGTRRGEGMRRGNEDREGEGRMGVREGGGTDKKLG